MSEPIPFHSFDAESSTDPKTLTTYSTDASIFQVMPSGVLFPEDSSHIMSSVRRVTKLVNQGTKTSLSVRAAGTCMSGGSLTNDIIIDVTKYMNRLGKANSPKPVIESAQNGDKLLTAQPGVYYRDFELFTKSQGLEMPVYPASHNLCAIGGMFGNNCEGRNRFLMERLHNLFIQQNIFFQMEMNMLFSRFQARHWGIKSLKIHSKANSIVMYII